MSSPRADLAGASTPATDQSNTLVALGERILLKVYRRLEAGPHPEIEMLAALRGSDAPVPAMLGSLHYVDRTGRETAVALVEEFVPGAEAGWEAPIERVAAHLRGEREAPLDEWRAAGAAAARLHRAAAERLGTRPAEPADAAALAERASAQLAEAATADEALADLSRAPARRPARPRSPRRDDPAAHPRRPPPRPAPAHAGRRC